MKYSAYHVYADHKELQSVYVNAYTFCFLFLRGEMIMLEKIKKYLRKKKFEYKRRKFCTEWNRRNRKWRECRHKRKMFERDLRRWLREYEG